MLQDGTFFIHLLKFSHVSDYLHVGFVLFSFRTDTSGLSLQRYNYFLVDHIGVRGGGFFGARDALGVVTYPFNQVLFSSTHFESADLLRISAMLSMQTGLQVILPFTGLF